ELSLDLALRLGEPARARRSIEEAIAVALDDAVRSPRRLSIARLLRWIERVAAWTRDRRRRQALPSRSLELAWPEAAAAWARSRAQLPEGARAELDAELARAARA